MSTRRVIDTMKIHGGGRVQIPKEIRSSLSLEDGDKLVFYSNNRGELCIEKGLSLDKKNGSFSTKPWPPT